MNSPAIQRIDEWIDWLAESWYRCVHVVMAVCFGTLVIGAVAMRFHLRAIGDWPVEPWWLRGLIEPLANIPLLIMIAVFATVFVASYRALTTENHA